MDKVSLLFVLLAAAATPVHLTRNPRFFGLSSLFGGGEEEETSPPSISDLSGHPIWKVHKYNGITLQPVPLTYEAGSSLPPPSTKQETPAPSYGPPPPTYGVPAEMGEGDDSASDISMGLDALGSLASLLPDGSSDSTEGGSTKDGDNNHGFLRSAIESVINAKSNIGSAISGLASGKRTVLDSLLTSQSSGDTDPTSLILGLLAQYPELASLLSRARGKGGHSLPKLPQLPDLPSIIGLKKIPKLPDLPEMTIPSKYPAPTPYSPPETYDVPPAPYQAPEPNPSPAPYSPTRPESTYGTPEISQTSSGSSETTFEPSYPPPTPSQYGAPQETSFGSFETKFEAVPELPAQVYGAPPATAYKAPASFPEATASSLLPPKPKYYSAQQSSETTFEPSYPPPTPSTEYGAPPATEYKAPASASFSEATASSLLPPKPKHYSAQQSSSSSALKNVAPSKATVQTFSAPATIVYQAPATGITTVVYPDHRFTSVDYKSQVPGIDSPDYVPPVLTALSQQWARNSDANEEILNHDSGFKPSKEIRSSPHSFFPTSQDYLPPFVQYKKDLSTEGSSKDEIAVPAPSGAAPEAPAETAASSAAARQVTRLREYPVPTVNAQFSDRFRGKVHIAPGEVTVDTAMRVEG